MNTRNSVNHCRLKINWFVRTYTRVTRVNLHSLHTPVSIGCPFFLRLLLMDADHWTPGILERLWSIHPSHIELLSNCIFFLLVGFKDKMFHLLLKRWSVLLTFHVNGHAWLINTAAETCKTKVINYTRCLLTTKYNGTHTYCMWAFLSSVPCSRVP